MQVTFTIDGDASDVNGLAESISGEANRLAKAFAFCADNPDAPIQRRIANLRALYSALVDATA